MHKKAGTHSNKFISAIAVLSISSAVMSSCNNDGSKAVQQKPAADSVSVFTLKKEYFEKPIVFPGELVPYERAEIYAKVSGYINTVKADIGDVVQQGQVLITLEAPEIIANAAQAGAELQTAKAKYIGSLDAYTRILNADKVPGTVATGEKERLKSQAQSDSAALEAAKSKLGVYTQLKDYLTIRAPFSGVVTQRNVDPGTLTGAASDKPLLVVENISKLRLRLPIPEAYIAATPENAKAGFTVDAYPGVTFEAVLARKAGAINQANRTESWEFIYDNSSKKLKSGMFANCRLNFKRTTPSFVVPASAVVTTQEKRFVIRLNNEKAEWVDVRNGIALSDSTEIFGNLNETDVILLRGNDEIKPGKTLIPQRINNNK